MIRNCSVLANSHLEMFLKAIGQLLGTTKGYSKVTGKCPKVIIASGQFLEAIEKLLGNAKLLPSATIGKTWQFQSLFSEVPHLC